MNKINTELKDNRTANGKEVSSSDLLGKIPYPAEYELQELDSDIRNFFSADIKVRYISSLPTLIQIQRHLRLLVNKRINSQSSSSNSENAESNI